MSGATHRAVDAVTARRAGLAYLMAGAGAVAFALWTWVVSTGVLAPLDAGSLTPGPDPASASGQIMAAIAVVTAPVVQYVVMAGLILWAVRRRLHNLAWASGATIVLVAAGSVGMKAWVARPRPVAAVP